VGYIGLRLKRLYFPLDDLEEGVSEGNVRQAAKLAEKYRSDFYDLLKKHDLQIEDFKKSP
jgi:hypothetical protein